MGVIRVHIHLFPHLPLQTVTHTQRFTKFQTLHYSKTPSSKPGRISCSNDIELALELETKIEKMKIQAVRTQEAMKMSRKMLYEEVCLYLGLGKDELKRKWETMQKEDKQILAQEFVSDWGSNFHPLSANSVKELVDQHLFHDNQHDSSSSSSLLFTGLKKLMGFPE